MMGLTERQKSALDFITRHLRETGGVQLPSYRALQRHLNCGGHGNAHRIVQALIERGHLRRLPPPFKGVTLVDRRVAYFRFDDASKRFVPLAKEQKAGKPHDRRRAVQTRNRREGGALS